MELKQKRYKGKPDSGDKIEALHDLKHSDSEIKSILLYILYTSKIFHTTESEGK